MSGFLGLKVPSPFLGKNNVFPPWNPTAVGTTGAWWRADNVTLTSGKVSTWQDISGQNLNLAQGTSGNRPTQVTNVVNGQPIVRFASASSNYLTSASFTAAPQPITWWAVAKWSGTAVTILLDGVGASNRQAILNDSTTTVAMFSGSFLDATYTFTNWTTYVAIFNGTSSVLRANGTQIALGDTGSESLTGVTVGGAYNQTAFWDGDAAEIGFTKQALSGNNLTNLERYLRTRYATW